MNRACREAMTILKSWHVSSVWPAVLTAAFCALGTVLTATTPATLTVQAGEAPVQVTANTPEPQVPSDYVIGPEDVLTVNFRNDADLNAEVVVRPDGKISLQLVKEVAVSGLTIEELRVRLNTAYAAYIKGDPAVSVQSKLIKSRKVSIIGEVTRQGEYPLLGPTDVVQLLAQAGGLTIYANKKRILIIRTVNGTPTSRTFNYEDIEKGRNLDQNILLLPGDRIIVPE